jgi:UDPglucose 6-dehydrogenase
VYVIGCKHDGFEKIKFPAGSVVIDPHRYIPAQENVIVHHVGVGQ